MKKCFECETTKDLQEHHIVPRSRGGTKTVTLCYQCHMKAHGRSGKGLNHARLVREGLLKKKEELAKEGKKLGGPKIEKARKQASKVNKQRFIDFRAKTGPEAFSIRKELEAEGKKSTFQAIANLMNERGIKTMTGKPWSPSGVMQMIKAYKGDPKKNK